MTHGARSEILNMYSSRVRGGEDSVQALRNAINSRSTTHPSTQIEEARQRLQSHTEGGLGRSAPSPQETAQTLGSDTVSPNQILQELREAAPSPQSPPVSTVPIPGELSAEAEEFIDSAMAVASAAIEDPSSLDPHTALSILNQGRDVIRAQGRSRVLSEEMYDALNDIENAIFILEGPVGSPSPPLPTSSGVAATTPQPDDIEETLRAIRRIIGEEHSS